MNRKTFAVLPGFFALLALAACSSSTKSTPPSTASEPAVQGKLEAPVVVNAQLENASARVTVRFDAPATGVRVNVHGLDGLVVTSPPTLAENADFPQATTASYDVAYTRGAGRSHLVVSVSGEFKGAQRTRVASFAIGTPTDSQRSSNATKAEGANGERIKVMPADTQ
ncbi:hypothetical protein ATI61_101376 [Archangium gephyra]|uniref:Lipoprotein n=1 Tax=Archangium gephyra TaxID=48 RepID=A0AAC8QBS0_9BACT|nr:hypothetical protein [Archangium gephyra]AKJ04539.1 Hypothetical protein AA314_06165 [Archangium gephyra]REG37392.1 hypothetical protein ATI61_101376 [Archangium gephyra]